MNFLGAGGVENSLNFRELIGATYGETGAYCLPQVTLSSILNRIEGLKDSWLLS